MSIGATASTMGSILPTPAEDPPVDPKAARCDVCHGYAGERVARGGRRRILRFGLEFRPKGKLGRGRVTRHLRLCEPCWKGLPA